MSIQFHPRNYFFFLFYCFLIKWLLLFICFLLPLGLSAQPALPSGFRLRLSPLYCTGFSLRFRGTSAAETFFRDRENLQLLTLPIANFDYADRIFLDGYVHQDSGTGNPNSVTPDSTWFWGYQNESQYNSQNQTLTFQRLAWAQQLSTSFTAHCRPEHSRVQDSALGLELSGEYPLLQTESTELGLQLAWLAIPKLDFRQRLSNFSATWNQHCQPLEVLETYTYDVSGIVIPAPGHTGTFLGPFDSPPVIPSPIIPNRPQNIDQDLTGNSLPADSSSEHYHNQIKSNLRCDSHELLLGIALRRHIIPNRLLATIAPSAALTILNLAAKRQETLLTEDNRLVAAWQNRARQQRLLPGLALTGRLEYYFAKSWFLDGAVACQWYPEEVNLSLGPSRITLRSSKMTLGISLGYRF